jgi:hypothetical protein
MADINNVLDNFENIKVLAYADDLKLYMHVSRTWTVYKVGVVKRSMT